MGEWLAVHAVSSYPVSAYACADCQIERVFVDFRIFSLDYWPCAGEKQLNIIRLPKTYAFLEQVRNTCQTRLKLVT